MDVLILRTLSKHITQPQQMINLVPYTREKKYTTKESCLGVKYIKTMDPNFIQWAKSVTHELKPHVLTHPCLCLGSCSWY